jgi:opacity protein-like surface antigen
MSSRVLRVALGCLIACAATPAWAQEPRAEIGATVGWTISDGVSGDAVRVPGAGTFDRIDPKDAFSWGLRGGFFVNPHVEIGFLFNQQQSALEVGGQTEVAGGATTVELGNVAVRNYHGYVAYNFGASNAAVRPYVLGGLGATQYGSVDARLGTLERSIGGSSKFSLTFGGGLKLQTSDRVSFRLEGRLTPTYVKSDVVGWWCDPFWGCYLVGNAQYANQFDVAGGINFRF